MNGFTELINSISGCIAGHIAPAHSFEKIKQEIKDEYIQENEYIDNQDIKDNNK